MVAAWKVVARASFDDHAASTCRRQCACLLRASVHRRHPSRLPQDMYASINDVPTCVRAGRKPQTCAIDLHARSVHHADFAHTNPYTCIHHVLACSTCRRCITYALTWCCLLPGINNKAVSHGIPSEDDTLAMRVAGQVVSSWPHTPDQSTLQSRPHRVSMYPVRLQQAVRGHASWPGQQAM